MERVLTEIKVSVAIIVELVFGFLTGLLILGLVPADGVDFNVLGSLVLMLPCAALYHLAGRYLRGRIPGRN